jgi:hypothetical protein
LYLFKGKGYCLDVRFRSDAIVVHQLPVVSSVADDAVIGAAGPVDFPLVGALVLLIRRLGFWIQNHSLLLDDWKERVQAKAAPRAERGLNEEDDDNQAK